MNKEFDRAARAAVEACFAQASQLLYSEPETGTISAHVADRLFLSAPFGMENPYVRQGLELLDAWCVEAAESPEDFDERIAELQREWLRLFVGTGVPEAPCWESFYVEPNSQMFGRCTLEVRACYRRHGLQIERIHSEPDDHLGLMLGFMGRLVGVEAEALANGNDVSARQAVEEQGAFLAEHVLPWLAVWRYSAFERAKTDYYRGVAQFVFGLCACYAERFGITFDEADQAFKRMRG